MLFPVTCPLCRTAGSAPCAACIEMLVPGRVVHSIDGLRSCRALVEYDACGAELVHGLKYRNARRLLPWLGQAMGELVPAEVDVITWAPTSSSHRRERGFDQAYLLAKAISRCTRISCRPLLVRVGHRSQTGLGRQERLTGVQFRARQAHGLRVLLVDDVVTTGATLSAASAELARQGVDAVHGIVMARTPDEGPLAQADQKAYSSG